MSTQDVANAMGLGLKSTIRYAPSLRRRRAFQAAFRFLARLLEQYAPAGAHDAVHGGVVPESTLIVSCGSGCP